MMVVVNREDVFDEQNVGLIFDDYTKLKDCVVIVHKRDLAGKIISCGMVLSLDEYREVDASFSHAFGVKEGRDLEFTSNYRIKFESDELEVSDERENRKSKRLSAGVIFSQNGKHLITITNE